MALPILKIMLFKFIAENNEITGYDFLKHCKENGITASAGSVYPHLKEFESKGLVKKISKGRKNYYSLTEDGKKYYEQVRLYKDSTRSVLKKMGIAFEANSLKIPSELRSKFGNLYYKVYSTKWKSKKSLQELLKTIKDVEIALRRHIDGESD